VLQRVAAFRVEEAARIGVGVQIQHRLVLQLRGVRLGPFGRTQQAGSSPSQLAYTNVRLGFQPLFSSDRSPWLPTAGRPVRTAGPTPEHPPVPVIARTTHSSGLSEPRILAMTSYRGLRPQSELIDRCTVAGPGPR